MFFSTDTSNLPSIGELICIRGSVKNDRPYRVIGRSLNKEDGQVYVDVIDDSTNENMDRCKVEIFSFWPMQGDTVLIIMGPYMDWLAKQLQVAKNQNNRTNLQRVQDRFRACELASKTTDELMQKHTLELVEGTGVTAMGAVRNENGRLFRCPLKCLAVLNKKDRRTDSKAVQLDLIA